MENNQHNPQPRRDAILPKPSKVVYTINAIGDRWLDQIGDFLKSIWRAITGGGVFSWIVISGLLLFTTLSCCALSNLVALIWAVGNNR